MAAHRHGGGGHRLGFNALFEALEPSWAPKALATVFLLIAVFVFVSAQRRAVVITSRLEAHAVRSLKPMNIGILTVALVGATVGLIAGIWMLA